MPTDEDILKARWPELAVEAEAESSGGEGGQKGEAEEKEPEEEPEAQGGEGEAAASAEGEGEAAESEEGSEPEDLEALIAKSDVLAKEWEAKKAELEEAGRRKAQSELQPRIDRANEHLAAVRATLTKAVEWIGAVAGALNKAAEAGTLDAASLNQVLSSNPDAFRAFTAVSGAHGFYHAMRGVAASFGQDAGGEEFTRRWVQRWSDIETGAEGDPAKAAPQAFREMLADRDEALRKRIEEPLRKKIAALEAQLERARLAARKSGGPDLAAKDSGGAVLTPEAIENMTDEEYERRRPEILRWLGAQLSARR